jgi:membrane-associated protein
MLDIILHLDVHLTQLIENYHQWAYLILALIIFCETGLVATPFLPGDSLLFAIGAISVKTEALSLSLLIPLLFIAALVGDNVNYFIGRKLGTKLFSFGLLSKFLRKEHLDKTHTFYEKHGGKTIIIARFLPIIRTFAPFVAGIAQMPYLKFIGFSITGALVWIVSLTLAGYYLGNLPIIKDNFQYMVLLIIAVSLLPLIIAYFKGPVKTKS